jgi:hypothetical protein
MFGFGEREKRERSCGCEKRERELKKKKKKRRRVGVWSITQKFMCEWSMKSHLYVTDLIGDHKRLYLVKSCTVCGRSCKMVLLLHISLALN